MDTLTHDYVMYAQGLCRASICTSLPIEEALARANTLDHPGTAQGWQMCADPAFHGGESNPCPCDTQPDTHKHYLLEC